MANTIKLDLQGQTVVEKVQFIRQVVIKLTSNADFTSPDPSLVQLAAKADALESAYNTQQTKQQEAQAATTTLHAVEAEADAALNKIANYVEDKSGGDPAKIQGAGLSLRSARTSTTTLDAPQNLSLTAGDNDGELDAQWDKVNKSKSYEVQISDDPPTNTSWAFVKTATKSSCILTGLTSGAKKWVRVRALGPNDTTGPWSDPAAKRVP